MSDNDNTENNEDKLLYCSFCGKNQNEVRKLIAGPSVYICNECIDLCNDIIKEEISEASEDEEEDFPVPMEIKATLDAAKNLKNDIVVVFQPHRYSRTKILIHEFVRVLSKINHLILLETYSAGEKIIKGATTKDIYLRLKGNKKNVVHLKDIKNLNIHLKKYTINNNNIIFMGAGSISNIAKKYFNS